MVDQNTLDLVFRILPFAFSGFAWFFTKPTQEEARISRLRKNLLTDLRFKIALELSAEIPVKDNTHNDQDYLSLVSNSLREYFYRNNDFVKDYVTCERKFNSYILALRVFKYSIILLPILIVSALIVLYRIINVDYSLWGLVFYLMLFLVSFGIMEWKKDSYHSLCNKYEVVNDS